MGAIAGGVLDANGYGDVRVLGFSCDIAVADTREM